LDSVETLKDRRERQDMALVHKYVYKGGQELFPQPRDNGGARTRRAEGVESLTAQYTHTDARKYFITVRVVEGWNGLPNLIRAELRHDKFIRCPCLS
jgi:hypothetical protein